MLLSGYFCIQSIRQFPSKFNFKNTILLSGDSIASAVARECCGKIMLLREHAEKSLYVNLNIQALEDNHIKIHWVCVLWKENLEQT